MTPNTVDPRLLDILACPACDSRPALKLSDDLMTLNCQQCSRHYPIVNGIPVLIVDEAKISPKRNPL